MELCIWFENGVTAYFKEVETITSNDEHKLMFNYFGQFSQQKKKATFDLRQIVGYSISKE